MNIRFLITVTLVGLLMSLPSEAQTRKINTLKKERTQLKKRISQREKALKNNQVHVRQQLDFLKKINGDIVKQKLTITNITSDITILNDKIATLEKQRKDLMQELEICKFRYKQSVMYMYRNRSAQSKLLFIFSAQNFRQMYRRMRYMSEYAKYQRVQGEIIARKERTLLGIQNKLLATKSEKNIKLLDERTAQLSLEQQQTQRKKVVGGLEKEQRTLQKVLSKERNQYVQLNSNIDRLIQLEIAAAEKRRKEAERKRKLEAERALAASKRKQSAQTNKQTDKKTQRNTRKSTKSKTYIAENQDVQLSRGFASNQGHLPVPVTGAYYISSHYGQNAIEGLRGVKLDNKGTNYTAKGPSNARAIFDGEVSAVFSFGGLVNVLIRHGSYISVYCNLSSALVHQGQKVRTRQNIGKIAPDNVGGYTLHFQLRKETARLNPEQWIGR